MSAPAPDGYVPHGVDVLRTYGEGFAGRTAELAALDRAWDGGTRVFVLHAEGGAGKTRVVARWLSQVRDAGWRGAGRVFVHSFYSQGSDERRNASSELFFEQALEHFGHTGPRLTDPTEQGRTLARLVVEQHGLLVLDGLEPLQHPPYFDQGRLKDPAIHSLLLSLAIGRLGEPSGSGLCVVTSRQTVVELRDKAGQVVVQQPLDRLDAAAGAELLRQLEVRGPQRELEEAVEEARGHAYSLMLLGTYLRDATADHDIRRRREIPLLDQDEEQEHRYHARHLFGAYVEHLGETSPEVAVLRLLGFFDRPAEEKLLTVLREATKSELSVLTSPLRNLPEADWRRILSRLTVLRLIDIATSPSPPIDSHPLLREYFAEQLRTRFPEAWQAGHRRLFEHLGETTEHRPATLAGLQSLYQAVAHGCLAGLHEQARANVYRDRILRGTGDGGFYSIRKLGAIGTDLGAVACFFTTPWTALAPSLAPADQAWLLNEAATRLRALGRLTEAVEPMRVGLEMRVEQGVWTSAAIIAGNLSELELMRGEVAAAVTAGVQSVTYADRSGNTFQQMGKRTTQADALHQAGRRDESRRLFEDAEARQAADQPEYPRLYSLPGFRYCDLLLAEAQRAAWQRWLIEDAGLAETLTTSIAACEAAFERATYALQLAERHQLSLLTKALDRLTLARATLYKTLLGSSGEWRSADIHITTAVDGLRAAGAMNHAPRGLLTRAWLRCVLGEEAGSRADLDEAWEIAERGPMPLFQADIQLTRARLFRDRAALEAAQRLIEKHGYHRRDGELADALEAAKGWDLHPRPPLLPSRPADILPPEEEVPPQPTELAGQLPRGAMRARITTLAQIMKLQREAGSRFVLMLGAGASLSSGITPTGTLMQELLDKFGADIPPDGDLTDRFDILWRRTPDDLRRLFLTPYLNREPSKGYFDLARLIQERFIDLVITFNYDDLLRKALQQAGFHDYHQVIRGETDPAKLRQLVESPPARLSILKMHGSLYSADTFLFDRNEMLDYPRDLAELFGRLTRRNIIVCGYGFNDNCVVRAFSTEGGSIFWVNPSGAPANAKGFLQRRRSSDFVISGDLGKFDTFFSELSAEVFKGAEAEPVGALGTGPATAGEHRTPVELVAAQPTAPAGATPEPTLTTDQLFEQLKRLPAAQLEELVFRYDPHNSVSGKNEAQAVRAIELLKVMQNRDDGLATLQAELQRLRRGGH